MASMSALARTSTTGGRIDRLPRRRVRLLVVLGGVALGVAACGGMSNGSASSGQPAVAASAPSPTGQLLATESTTVGTVLVNGQAMTVYEFAADSPGHSTCAGKCAQYWPPVPAPASLPTSVAGVTATLGSLTRADGTKQLTVDGWPLYTYAGDTKPGAIAGQGVNASGGLWWVVSPAGTAVMAMPTKAPSSSPSTSKSGGGGGWA